jgi:copper(I)-binding protein
MMRTTIVLAVAVLLPAVTAAQEPVPHRHPVQVRDAWVRAQPNAAGMSVFYGTLVNESDRDWTVTRVMCERVRNPEIHETVMENDVARMRRVAELRLAPGQRAEMRPGGLHLMLMGLEAPLAPGEYVYCTFLAGDVVVARDRGIVRAP